MTLTIWKTKTTGVNYSLQLTGRLSAFKHVCKQNFIATCMITGKLNTVLDLLLNYSEWIRPSTTQWRNKITPGLIHEHRRKETHWHVTLGLEQISDGSDWERKQLVAWTSKPEWRRRDSTASLMLLISLRHNILSHRNNQSHTGILLLIAAILAMWKVFYLLISRKVIRIWKKLIRKISLGKNIMNTTTLRA